MDLFILLQKASQLSADRQRTVVESVRIAADDDADQLQEEGQVGSTEQQQAQILQQRLSPSELAHQESLIQEREADIREIETGIHELHEIFRDLGGLVTSQGEMLDNIESNISNIAVDATGAADELGVAHQYQRKAGRRAACLMVVVGIVICVVLLAVLS